MQKVPSMSFLCVRKRERTREKAERVHVCAHCTFMLGMVAGEPAYAHVYVRVQTFT